MRSKNMLLLLVIMTIFSCGYRQEVKDRLNVRIDDRGFATVTDAQTGQNIMRGLSAVYMDERGQTVNFPRKNFMLYRRTFADDMGNGTETVLEADTLDHQHLKWTLRTLRDQPVLLLRLTIRNDRADTVRIIQMDPLISVPDSGGIVLEPRSALQYLDIEPQTWAPKRMQVLDGEGTGKLITAVADTQNRGVVVGCASVERFRGFFNIRDQREDAGVLQIDASNHIDSQLQLVPGGKLKSEWIYIDAVNDVLTGLENWASYTGSVNHAVVSDPPAAGFYTWYYYRDKVSEQIMLDNARFLAENRDRFPVNWVHIDWGWQRKYSTGDTTANEKFPHGLRWLAKEITNLGFHPSIWVNPFMYTRPTAEAVTQHPDIFLRDSTGNLVEREPIRNIMGREFGNMEYAILDGVTNVLDVSNPAAYGFLQDRYNWVRGMGFDMAMMDFIVAGQDEKECGDHLKYNNVSTYEGIRRALTAARLGLGQDAGILGCGVIYESVIGISNLTRISTDAPAIWSCVKTACNDLILQYFMNNKLWTNYADGLFVRNELSPYWRSEWWDENRNLVPMVLSDDEAEFYTAVTALSGAAVMYTEDIQRLKPERQWLLSMALPIYNDGQFKPVDLFRTTTPKTLQRVCEQNGRQWILAAGLNWSNEPDESGLDLSLLDLKRGVKYHAFDVFKQKYIGLADSKSRLGPVALHGVLLVNLVPELDRPQVIGSDTHISQGGVEIAKETWNAESNDLTLQLKDLYGRKGCFYIHVPAAYHYREGMGNTRPVENGNILKVPVVLDGEKNVTLSFDRD